MRHEIQTITKLSLRTYGCITNRFGKHVIAMNSFSALAVAYHSSVHAAKTAAVTGEPEAQLTTPVSNLLVGLAKETKDIGELRFIRESRLDRTRPDFAVLQIKNGKTYQKGYVELKAPTVTLNTEEWTGRNGQQWQQMKGEAEILLVCNGRSARLFVNGISKGETADLPFEDPATWDPAPLIKLLNLFLNERPAPVTRVVDLSDRLAVRTADLRDRLLWLLDQTDAPGEATRGGLSAWKAHVHPDATPRSFADGVSQVVAYGMVLAALSGDNPDNDADGIISVAEARASIRNVSPVLAAAFAPLIDKPILFKAVEVEIGALETLISAIDAKKVNSSADRRGEPWLYFYEDFLSKYDPEERRQAGVYYTPIDVVQAMTSMVDHLLVKRFNKRLGFADPSVVTLDPAAGTGTFPLAVLDKAVERATEVRGKAGPSQAAQTLGKNLFAFELLPGPYSVTHLRLTQRLRKFSPSYEGEARVLLTDTLESPLDPQEQLALFGDAEVLAAEQNRAKRVKLEQDVTVVIGNPPYRRVNRGIKGRGLGGWVVDGKVPKRKGDKSLFDDILDVAKKLTIFSHHASLYNLYVYFWRWAIWKAFEAQGSGPSVVSFITGNSWLTGPGFVGLRQLVREICDEGWIIDLGGDNRAAEPEDNIFSIETPVAIVVLVRDAASNKKTPANLHYRRLEGDAPAKLASLKKMATESNPFVGKWLESPTGLTDALLPGTSDTQWNSLPALSDIFPWQQPGCKFGRTWPIAADSETLSRRWNRLTESPLEERPSLFATGTSGRNIETKVKGLKRLAEVSVSDLPQPIVRYGFRSFDRQWAFNDPRMAKTESPSLWQSYSERQIYFSTLMTGKLSDGPCLTASPDVPDLHYFCGRGGKDIIPLYRDAEGKKPNITAGLLKSLAEKIGAQSVSPEDLAAYAYAVMSCPQYYRTFAEPLETPGPRLPITTDRILWEKTVQVGKHLIWLHTFAEKFRDEGADRGHFVPSVRGIGWEVSISRLPKDQSEIIYHENTRTITIGDGIVEGVSRKVWNYSVSGRAVLQTWLSYRTAKGAGKAVSSKSNLDRIRPDEWPDEWNDELLDLVRILTLTTKINAYSSRLFRQICRGNLISAIEFPTPKAAERKPPKASAPQLFE
ncbi:N-6 DNA methylase [Agrobacterium genomosp. 3]|uniref:type ISP restriction/modification enzyme n=1 Tax=Agrobacterium tomkonis TaxID=1183410 RepID=UPI001CD8EE85|nr:N-6 DNA methylase [Agrobacterium tomkonis]MCA1879847.1 N-6 DNA methylase [Agrobacterium tumefaciens]